MVHYIQSSTIPCIKIFYVEKAYLKKAQILEMGGIDAPSCDERHKLIHPRGTLIHTLQKFILAVGILYRQHMPIYDFLSHLEPY